MTETNTPKGSATASMTVIQRAEGAVVSSNAKDAEDKFAQLYSNTGQKVKILRPPYDLKLLRRIVQESDSLPPCISAMEVNVDGTGYDIVKKDGSEGGDQAEGLKGFFEECYPALNFLTLRRALRRDLEEVGFGFVEIIRNNNDDIVFSRRISPDDMRLVALDEAVTVDKSVIRAGKEFKVKVLLRERRFAQVIGNKTVYFKEFGASRDLNKDTGVWNEVGNRLAAEKRATEIVYFSVTLDSDSPYGVPRWLHNSPSVVGARKAEELNLEFFTSGGIPPILITLAGGAFTEDTKLLLQNLFSGSPDKKMGAALLEAYPTGGSIDSSGSVSLDVHKFGAESQKDSMFEGYLDKCERRVRRSYRLPPLFVGKTEDFSYATAFASYTVAEEQVFAPERLEFDTIINTTIMADKSMGGGEFIYKSNPLTVKDIETRFKALELANGSNTLTSEELVKQVNKLAGTDFEWNGEEGPKPQDILDAISSASSSDEEGDGAVGDAVDEETDEANPDEGGKATKKSEGFSSVMDLIQFSDRVLKTIT
ncbi:MAG: hypothetical protein OEX12_12525, partial [Gammaproteobacteria bacterium]|nr:hypothetical protein [Gammaproteobacteria bacterium]